MYDFLFEGRDPVAEPGTWTGSRATGGPCSPSSPTSSSTPWQGFGLYQSPKRRLDPVLRELGQIRAGWAAGSQFVFSQHCKSLRDLGVAEEKIQAIPTGRTATCYDETERLVLAYTDCLVYDHGRVPDALFADALQEHLSDEEILELTYITALYFQHAVMSRALRTEFDDRGDPGGRGARAGGRPNHECPGLARAGDRWPTEPDPRPGRLLLEADEGSVAMGYRCRASAVVVLAVVAGLAAACGGSHGTAGRRPGTTPAAATGVVTGTADACSGIMAEATAPGGRRGARRSSAGHRPRAR
jgi:hypothetical protein